MYRGVVALIDARWSVLLASVLALACGTEDDSGSDTESTSAADGSDDDGGDGPAFGGECSSLPADGPTVGPEAVGPTGFPFRCNPRTQMGGGAYQCCSDDPATVGGALPDYAGKNIDGADTPLFSGDNNGLGSWGLCVKTADIPAGSGLTEPAAAGCPIPCNPTWDDASTAAVCGTGQVCCQTQELQESDCVPDIISSEFRPVTGLDIDVPNPDGSVVTDWAPGAHATHQDPGTSACTQIAGGDPSSATFQDCVLQLTVANQRGFCQSLGPGEACPLVAPTYVDACEALSM